MHIYMHKDEGELCDLEKRRLSNVKRNEEVLNYLGLKKVYACLYIVCNVIAYHVYGIFLLTYL